MLSKELTTPVERATSYICSVAMKRRMEEDNTVGGDKGELVTHDNLLEPLEQLSKEREEVAEEVKKVKVCEYSPVNYDNEQNIREIRAILKMNEEIFDRCMDDFMIRTWMGDSGEWCTSFNRITYEMVTVRARNNVTEVITHPIRTTKEFRTTPLSKLPQGLEDIFVSRCSTGKFQDFIDFNAFFKRSLLLHETVLEQFLPKLKEHLMSIQVCLGEIDAWVIQEPQGNITFLEKTFETRMEIPDDKVTLGPHKCSCYTHLPNEICLSCGKKYCDQLPWTKRCNDKSRYESFQCEYYQILKQCKNEGKHEANFNLTNEKERIRLTKFLEFIGID
jgi:hypothetical protein